MQHCAQFADVYLLCLKMNWEVPGWISFASMFVVCVTGMSHLQLFISDFFQFLSLESISVLNDALSQIESQGNVSMNSASSESVVSSSVDTVSTSVYQMHSKLGENLEQRDLCCWSASTLSCCLQKERWVLNSEVRKENKKRLQTLLFIFLIDDGKT